MSGSSAPGALQEWRSHWPVMLPCFFGTMLCAMHGAVIGVMVVPMEQDLGWARSEITGGFLLISVIALVASPLAGAVVDRIGARRIGLFGILAYCSAFALLSTTSDSVIHWFALWALLALTVMLVMPVVWLSIINGYFVKSRGLAMAVALSATGMSLAVFPAIADALVGVAGWRNAFVLLAAIAAAVIFPLVFFLFKPAHGVGEGAAARARMAKKASPGPAATKQARTIPFILIAIAAGLFAVSVSALTTNAVPVLIGEGLDPSMAAKVVGLAGLGTLLGRLGGGYLLDRFNANYVAAATALLPIVPAVIFLSTDQSIIGAMFACFIIGLASGAEIDCCAYITARQFGTRNFGTLFGTINGVLLFGNGMAPIIANGIYDLSGAYDLALIGFIPIWVITSLLFMTLVRFPPVEAYDVPPAEAGASPQAH